MSPSHSVRGALFYTMRIRDVDWDNWNPRETATLLFVIRDGQVLLIEKKRGLGAGKINGPGGRLEPDERPAECAVREVEEELGVTPTAVDHCGDLRFQFVDGHSILCHVYRASNCVGEARETDEAVPRWTALNNIPYAEMWADDIHWVPLMIDRQHFQGCFVLDGDTLLDHDVRVIESP